MVAVALVLCAVLQAAASLVTLHAVWKNKAPRRERV